MPDPQPGELWTVQLIQVNEDLSSRPRRRRRRIELREGYKLQRDGSVAKIFRCINQMEDRYIEEVKRDACFVHKVDERLSEHRGHGSARTQRANQDAG
jgi:hypothetical protein